MAARTPPADDNPWSNAPSSAGLKGEQQEQELGGAHEEEKPVLDAAYAPIDGISDPWAALEGSSSTAVRPTVSLVDDFDPFSPSKASFTDVAAKAATSPPLSPSSPAPSSPSAGTSLASPSASEPEGARTPILASIASAFRRTSSSGASTPVPDGAKAQRAGGVVAAIVGRGSMSTPQPGPSREETVQPAGDAPFDFNRFLEQMRDPRSDAIAKYLRSFLKEFSKRTWKVNDQIVVINDFLDFIASKMRTCETWRALSEHDFDNAIEGMEKLVMNRVFDRTFTPALPENVRNNNPTDDLERDHVLQQRIRLFGWLREEHLDLPPTTEDTTRFLNFAKAELLKINQYKAPRDKLITILNCCKVIFGLMRHAGKDESADLFVPYLILIVLRANPDHLVSNLQYIQRFRNPERLQGEAGYYLSSINGAISFIETMDHSSLANISQDDFEHQMEQAIADIEPITRQANPPLSAQVAAAEPDAVAQPVAGGIFDKPIDALKGVFSDLSIRRGGDSQLITGVPVGGNSAAATPQSPTGPEPSPRRRRGYTPSLYSRSTESLLPPSAHSSGTTPVAPPTAEEEEARKRHQASLDTLRQMFPQVEHDVLAVVLLSQNGDLHRAIDSLLEMT